MKRNELKKVLKPLIKECIKEVIFEEGALSGIITEVAKGLGNVNVPLPQSIAKPKNNFNQIRENEGTKQAKQQLEEVKRDLQKSTGLKGVFEGTTPMRSGGGGQGSQHGALRDMNPSDPGVDISGIMKIAGGAWNQLK